MHQRSVLEIKTLVLTSVILSTMLLGGCSSARYGMATKDWQALPYQQKRTMQANYARIAAARAQEKREQDGQPITSTTAKIQLVVKGGKALMPPFDKSYTYKPVTLTVYEGHCRSVAMVAKAGKRKTNLEACYLDDVVYLDPSKYEYQWHQGSLQFNYIPIWESETGFQYNNISSQGYAGLKDVTIRIKSLIAD